MSTLGCFTYAKIELPGPCRVSYVLIFKTCKTMYFDSARHTSKYIVKKYLRTHASGDFTISIAHFESSQFVRRTLPFREGRLCSDRFTFGLQKWFWIWTYLWQIGLNKFMILSMKASIANNGEKCFYNVPNNPGTLVLKGFCGFCIGEDNTWKRFRWKKWKHYRWGGLYSTVELWATGY